MIKMIIADDELHFRKYMERVLDWENLGFRICGSCKNAAEVLACINKQRVNIVLLDINMPGMDGISLAQQLREKDSSLLIVFVTGYSEFEYAKKALQLGAEDYLLKPFSKEELGEVMKKLKLKLKMKNEESQQKRMEENIVREELLKRWIHSGSEEKGAELRKSLERVEITWKKSYFLVAVLEIDSISAMRNRQEDIELWKFVVGNIAGEMLATLDEERILFQDYEDRVVVLLNTGRRISDNEATDAFRKAQQMVNETTGLEISAGISTQIKHAEEIPMAYRQAMSALEEKFLIGRNSIIFYEAVSKKSRRAHFYRLDLNERLLGSLRRHEKEVIREIISETKDKMKEELVASDYAYMIISGMISICLSYITEMNGDIIRIYGQDFTPYSQLYQSVSLEESFTLLEYIFEKAVDAFQTTYSKRGVEILQQVEKFIEENYYDCELSVEKIAEGVYLDSSYIRRVISRQSGCTVTDLVTSVRMKKARSWMEEENLTVGQISEKVGYAEPGYFSKCFKKYYGVSPREYQAQSRGRSGN